MPRSRRRRRPHTAWMDNIKTWTGLSVEESVRMTEDRYKWRKYVHGQPSGRGRLKNNDWSCYQCRCTGCNVRGGGGRRADATTDRVLGHRARHHRRLPSALPHRHHSLESTYRHRTRFASLPAADPRWGRAAQALPNRGKFRRTLDTLSVTVVN